MSQDPILKFDNNKEYVCSLKYDQGKRIEPSNPTYSETYLWGLKYQDADWVIFATPRLNDLLLDFVGEHKGKQCIIAKFRDNETGKFPFSVIPYVASEDRKEPAGQKVKAPNNAPAKEYTNQPIDWDLKESKKEHEIRKAICIKLAVDKIPEGAWDKKTEVEIRGKFTTLMLIISDDLALVIEKLKCADNVFHLEAMWKKYSHLWRNLLSKDDLGTAIDTCAKLRKDLEADNKRALNPKADPEQASVDVGDGLDTDNLPF